ncbi:MAG: ERCC4 domain-containing protein [Parasporobacterium sp.]|nr:ERCC4 domain-containing protein [Parasporobacterium sp.]
MVIGVDKNQLIGSHGASNQRKHSQMVREGVQLVPLRIPFGDYIKVTDDIQALIDKHGAENIHKRDLQDLITVSIDTKKNLVEVCGNICSKQHERFKEELIKSQGRLILLIEEPNITILEDVYFWDNPRRKYSPKAPTGAALYKSLCTIKREYKIDIRFCNRKDTGR